jgi:hypothetical protein
MPGFLGSKWVELMIAPRRELFELPGKGKDAEDSAFRFVTHDDLELNWDDDHYVVFTLNAKHALRGFGKVLKQI